jgi:hypothetical protein
VGTAAAEGTPEARNRGIAAVRELMDRTGVDPKELDKDKDIYDAVRQFLENTGFNPALIPPHRY